MDENELATLLDRYKRGVCTESERLLIESLHLYTYNSEKTPENPAAKARVWKRWQTVSNATNRKSSGPWLAAAAAVLLIAAGSLVYHFAADAPTDHQIVDIPAGGNRAILKLADGQTVQLDSNQNGVMILPDRLLYTDSTKVANLYAGTAAVEEEVYNEVVTPKGGMYQVVLADGTKVWLNADSKLKFPPKFTQHKREVSLVGEAYFEVSEQRSPVGGGSSRERVPFFVKTREQTVNVLGTEFNISAYPEETKTKTTLVEGLVQVTPTALPTGRQTIHPSPTTLNPGDQAVVGAGDMSVEKVDTAPFIAWKSGYIAFNEETLEYIMQEISRWYNVPVHFQGVDKRQRFGGTVSRYTNVSDVLRRLELTGKVHFKIEERGIVVSK